MRPNPLRERFSDGSPALGGWLAIPSPITAEAVAALDLAYVCIDTQHGVVGYDSMVPMLAVVGAAAPTPVVRVPWKGSEQIGKALDAGAMAVIVPMINTGEEAAAAVAATRYPPAGARSYGPTRVRALQGDDYFDRANDDIACIVMVETAEAVANLDEILSTDGVDAIYVGPSDLAISLGDRPATNGPRLNEALETIVDGCRRHGVVPGIHANAGLLAQRLDQGFRMVTVVADLGSLRSKLAEDMALIADGSAGPPDASLY